MRHVPGFDQGWRHYGRGGQRKGPHHIFQLARSRFSLYNQRTWFCRGKNHEMLIFFLFLRIRKKVTIC